MAGNIKVVKAERPFQKVAKDIIYDKTISPFTLGIYVKVLAYGDRELSMKTFAKMVGVSDGKLRAAFADLELAGYLRRIRVKGENQRFIGWDYEVGEVPFEQEQRTEVAKSRLSEKPKVGKAESRKSRNSENLQVNNKEYRDNKENNISTKNITGNDRPVPPTKKQVEDYARSQGFADPAGFADYYVRYQTEAGWVTGKGSKRHPIDNWKLNVIAWGRYRKGEIFTTQTETPKATRMMNGEEFDKLFG